MFFAEFILVLLKALANRMLLLRTLLTIFTRISPQVKQNLKRRLSVQQIEALKAEVSGGKGVPLEMHHSCRDL
ncbi:MAG: hypothetical protein Q4G66_12385 [bacterium]|nr:hypothetical protein [bacterium]